MKKISCLIMVLTCSLLTYTSSLRANVPPPPANQIIGINDGVFNDLTEADCRLCHENPDQYPVEDETISNRHHLLYGDIIPDPTDAPYGTPGQTYQCLSCHQQVINGTSITFIIERDCLVCHIQASSFELTVHHRTDLALGNLPQGPDCKACHGSLVDNIEDGHFIPTYDPSPRTPKPSGGAGLPLNSEGNGTGACDYCHSTGTGDPAVPGIDGASGVLVYSSEDTHHETGFWGGVGAHGFVCNWCHDQVPPYDEPIRVCENCHGQDALHNIQVDSNGDGIITPGVELPGYGHLGNPDDCWGCHGFAASADPPQFGSIIPFITSITKSVLTEGISTEVIISGSAFRNISGGVEITSIVTISDETSAMEFIPDSVSENSIRVTIPGILPAGNYILRAVKNEKISNPAPISVTPEVKITGSSCSQPEGTLTVSGTGFGTLPPEGTEGRLNLKLGGAPVAVNSWSDTLIQGSVTSCTGVTMVNALYGSAISCECPGNFDADSDVDGTDAQVFKSDFGRSTFHNPCGTSPVCNGDFDCDGDVDGTDARTFKQDFGRSTFQNPCSLCSVQEWCNYQ